MTICMDKFNFLTSNRLMICGLLLAASLNAYI